MGILDKYLLKKDKNLQKKIEIDNSLYEKIEELSKKKYNASVNKIVNVAIIELIESEDIKLYQRPKNELAVAHSFLIRETSFQKLEELREKYGISVYKLVNIAIKNVIDEIEKGA